MHLPFSCLCVPRGGSRPHLPMGSGFSSYKPCHILQVRGKNVCASRCVWLHWFPKQSGSQCSEWHDCVSWHLHCHLNFLLGGEPCQIGCPGLLPPGQSSSGAAMGLSGGSPTLTWSEQEPWTPSTSPVPWYPSPVSQRSHYHREVPPPVLPAPLTMLEVPLIAPLVGLRVHWRPVVLPTCCMFSPSEAAHGLPLRAG